MIRDRLDRYWTPSWPVHVLLRALDLPEGTAVLEPCCGREHRIDTILDRAGFEVVTGDLDDEVSCHFHWDFPQEVALRKRQVIEKVGPVDWIITNPPYTTTSTTAAAFVEACLEVCPRLAVLVRASWLEVTKDRDRLFTQHPPTHLIILPRADFDGPAIAGGNGAPHASAWVIWWPDTPGDLDAITAAPRSEVKRIPSERREFAPKAPAQGGLW